MIISVARKTKPQQGFLFFCYLLTEIKRSAKKSSRRINKLVRSRSKDPLFYSCVRVGGAAKLLRALSRHTVLYRYMWEEKLCGEDVSPSGVGNWTVLQAATIFRAFLSSLFRAFYPIRWRHEKFIWKFELTPGSHDPQRSTWSCFVQLLSHRIRRRKKRDLRTITSLSTKYKKRLWVYSGKGGNTGVLD